MGDFEKESSDNETLVTKEYVKSRQNIYSHPAINAYNKTADNTNRTAATLMKVITSLKDVSLDAKHEEGSCKINPHILLYIEKVEKGGMILLF